MSTFNIKPFEYSFSEEDIEFVLHEFGQILRHHGYLTLGQHGEAFEQAFASYHQTDQAIAVSSGTAALEIILKALDVKGGKVIVPTNTFGATIISVLAAGAIPVFADCGPDMALSPESAASKMSPEVKAIVTVHIGGLISPGTYALQELCADWKIPLVEDAAHAIGSRLNDRRAGDFGIASAFSFFNTKILTTGEGGMITTRDADLADRARLLRNHAKEQGNRMVTQGYNWRLPEVQALLGLRQLQRLDEFMEKRGAVAAIYDGILSDLSFIRLVQPSPGELPNYYKYIIVLESIQPEAVRQALMDRYQIPLAGYVYEEPCHLQPAFREFDGQGCTTAEQLCPSHICLPIYQAMSAAEAHHVGQAVRAVLLDLHAS